jgi:hypothetical protein
MEYRIGRISQEYRRWDSREKLARYRARSHLEPAGTVVMQALADLVLAARESVRCLRDGETGENIVIRSDGINPLAGF